jgi:hypothetical protein
MRLDVDYSILEHTNMSDEYTTVSIREDTKEYLEQQKPDGMGWDTFLKDGHGKIVEHTIEEPEVVSVEELSSRLDDLETAIKHKIERETRR